MKYFSKLLSMLLIGAMLVVTSCTDYDEDIKNLNNKVDDLKQELVEGQINPLKADLAATKTALEAAIADANKKVAENKEAIEALEEVDKAHEAAIAEANAAIAAAVATLEGQLAELESNHDADSEAVNAKIAAEVTKVNEAITAAVTRIAENEKDIAALEAKDAELVKGIADANAAIKANAEVIKTNTESSKRCCCC